MPPERIELSAFGFLCNITRPTLYHWAKKATYLCDGALIDIIGSKSICLSNEDEMPQKRQIAVKFYSMQLMSECSIKLDA